MWSREGEHLDRSAFLTSCLFSPSMEDLTPVWIFPVSFILRFVFYPVHWNCWWGWPAGERRETALVCT